MMPIDLTAQFAPILEGMVLVLIVAAAGVAFDALRARFPRRPAARAGGRTWGADAKPLRA